MERTIFSPYQLKVITLMEQVRTEEQMAEINDLLSRYFAQKAIQAADKLWDEGTIDNTVIESWKSEHMRTPYKQ